MPCQGNQTATAHHGAGQGRVVGQGFGKLSHGVQNHHHIVRRFGCQQFGVAGFALARVAGEHKFALGFDFESVALDRGHPDVAQDLVLRLLSDQHNHVAPIARGQPLGKGVGEHAVAGQGMQPVGVARCSPQLITAFADVEDDGGGGDFSKNLHQRLLLFFGQVQQQHLGLALVDLSQQFGGAFAIPLQVLQFHLVAGILQVVLELIERDLRRHQRPARGLTDECLLQRLAFVARVIAQPNHQNLPACRPDRQRHQRQRGPKP